MDYKVKFCGKSYDLPPRTLAVDEQIEVMRTLDGDYQAGRMTRRDAVEKMHGFAESLLPGVLPPLEEVDTNELTALCTNICAVYSAPVMRVKADAQMAALRETLNRPEVQKALAALRDMPKK